MSFGYELISEAETDRLQEFPEFGRIVPEYRNENIREIIFRHYRIATVDRHGSKIDPLSPHFRYHKPSARQYSGLFRLNPSPETVAPCCQAEVKLQLTLPQKLYESQILSLLNSRVRNFV